MPKQNHNSDIISGLIGSGFIVGLTILEFPLIVSALAGAGIYAGSRLLLSQGQNGYKLNSADNLSTDIKNRITNIENLFNKIQKEARNLPKNQIEKNIDRVLELGAETVKVLSDEKDAYRLLSEVKRLFLSLDKLLLRYLEILEYKSAKTGTREKVDADFENLLAKMITSLEKYYELGIKSNLKDFELDMKVIETKMDGLGRS